MNNEQLNEEKLLGELTEKFDAIPEIYSPDEDELRLIDERDKLEKEMACSLEACTENVDLILSYGLDEKLLNQLEWLIVFNLEYRKEEFMKSEFYERFKGYKVVKRAEMEYERMM